MARVKGAMMTRKRRKKVLKLAKGYWGAKSRHFKMAKQAVMKVWQLRLHRPQAAQARFPPPVDYPYFRRLPHQRHQLLHLYEWPEEGGRHPEPEDALRDCHCRPRRVYRPGGEGQGRSVKKAESAPEARDCLGRSCYVRPIFGKRGRGFPMEKITSRQNKTVREAAALLSSAEERAAPGGVPL